MIPAKRKVSRDLFKVLMRKGRSYHSAGFSLRVFFGNNDKPAKFSVAVPKKLEKSAVRRNGIKRRVYGVLHSFLPIARPGSLSAFFIKKKIDARALSGLNPEIQTILKKSGVIG
ncbi:MAG: ribonuclease P protein component [Candidatus Taylorbacteria bacterium]|nr:ribonuclease P protein component [Candidatus Taylorbacteria bacterium]